MVNAQFGVNICYQASSSSSYCKAFRLTVFLNRNYTHSWISRLEGCHFLSEYSGGFRNSERGVQPLAREARSQILGSPRPLPVTLAVRNEYV